ncbi:MAG: hypothetical protein CMI14_02830 [Oleispira sp.]|nr:hypothetical protein [Oleispira sp.]|tara:strand:- start:247 stop:1278 length:1032 start_codon:yes stop_codon:yes gene_type:complete
MENGLSTERTDFIKFTGKSGEYFKLWFVNMFLSIVTLGIYSAWAKVRDAQYLYGHTQVDGQSFRFLATPMQILKGRIVAVIVFALYMILSQINPIIGLIMALGFIVAMPWLIIQGLKFTMRMTAYRNVRFSFEGTYGGVIVHFLLLPIIGLVTFYLAMPWVLQQIHKYINSNITYGGKHFEQNSSASQYYIAALITVGIALIGAALVIGAFGMPMAPTEENPASLFLPMVLFIIIMNIAAAVFQSFIYNHLMETLSIDDVVSFKADMKPIAFAVLMLTNILLLIVTLGLAIPVVKIRTARYIASVTQVTIKPGIDKLVNTIEGSDSAFGEEAAGLFDTDMSFV